MVKFIIILFSFSAFAVNQEVIQECLNIAYPLSSKSISEIKLSLDKKKSICILLAKVGQPKLRINLKTENLDQFIKNYSIEVSPLKTTINPKFPEYIPAEITTLPDDSTLDNGNK